MSKSFELAKKYLGRRVTLEIDRSAGSTHPRHGFLYPINYGFVPRTLAPDGAELDGYYLSSVPVQTASGRCVAIIHRLTDDDDKLVVVPDGLDVTEEQIETLIHFQEQYFDHEILVAS
jgi:inorganic pyrophosphatase